MKSVARISSINRRSGITLLEVLIATFVMTVGLLSLAALLPVGRFEMQEADRFDRGSALGRAAYRQLLISSCLRPENWLYTPNSPSDPLYPVVGDLSSSATAVPNPFVRNPHPFMPHPKGSSAGVNGLPPLTPIILDPLVTMAQTMPGGNGFAIVGQFPMSGTPLLGPESSLPFIPRATLRNFPNVMNMGARNGITLMPLSAVEELFRSEDDLNLRLPADKSSRPFQEWWLDTRGSTKLARKAFGAYSWFVTIAPDVTEAMGAPIDSNVGIATVPGNGLTTRQFWVAVAVCFNREIQNFAARPELLARYDRSERVVWCDFVFSGLGTGSDARLRVQGVANVNDAEAALTVRAEQWIMAVGVAKNYCLGGNSPAMQTCIQWYRVTSAADQVTQDVNSATTWYRSVRLSGRDWSIGGYEDANSFSYADLGESSTCHAIIVNQVIGVYEKTMTLDGSSIWSN